MKKSDRNGKKADDPGYGFMLFFIWLVMSGLGAVVVWLSEGSGEGAKRFSMWVMAGCMVVRGWLWMVKRA